jgi:hypothetical protein
MFGLPVAPLASGATATTVAASSSVREAPIVGHKGSIYKLQGLTAAPLSFSARAAGRHLCRQLYVTPPRTCLELFPCMPVIMLIQNTAVLL